MHHTDAPALLWMSAVQTTVLSQQAHTHPPPPGRPTQPGWRPAVGGRPGRRRGAAPRPESCAAATAALRCPPDRPAPAPRRRRPAPPAGAAASVGGAAGGTRPLRRWRAGAGGRLGGWQSHKPGAGQLGRCNLKPRDKSCSARALHQAAQGSPAAADGMPPPLTRQPSPQLQAAQLCGV